MSKQIPIGWSESTLGLVSNIVMGQSPSSDTYNDDRIGLPFFQGKTDFGSRSPKVRVWCSKPTKVAEKDSILFSVRAPVGDINVANRKSCIGRGLAAITGTKVNQNYLYQQITLAKTSFQLVAQGSTFEAISGSELRNFKLIIPPLQEQQKIAAILTSVDEVIEKTQAQIDKLKDLKSGMMQELLTKGVGIKQGDKYAPHIEFKDSPVGKIPKSWEVLDLDDVASVVDSMHQTPTFSDVGMPMVRVTEIRQNDILDISGAMLVNAKTFNAFSKNYKPNVGDILIARVGAYFGATAYISLEHEFCLGQNTASIRPNTILSEFLFICLNSENVRSQMNDAVAVGAQPSLSLKAIKELKIVIPSHQEQKVISGSINSVSKRVSMAQKKLQQLKNTKKALMQDLLTGKVRVKVDNDSVV